MSEDINVLALVKGSERYIFLYDDSNRSKTLRVLGRYASSPELSFSWYDAAVLSQKIRRQSQQAAQPSHRFQLPQMTDEYRDDFV
ncbi:MAG: hypothetical protein ACE1ZA_11565 [Pseudomonadales bacterium]